MSIQTFIKTARFNLKLMQEKVNAAQNAQVSNARSTVRMLGIPFALAFVFCLMAIAQPVSAGAMNDSITPILEDVAGLFTPLLTLIIAAVPVIIALAVVGFVLGIFGVILGKIKL